MSQTPHDENRALTIRLTAVSAFATTPDPARALAAVFALIPPHIVARAACLHEDPNYCVEVRRQIIRYRTSKHIPDSVIDSIAD